VRADLRVRDDAVGVVAGELRRQREPVLRQPHEHDGGAEVLLVGALRERRVEVALLDVARLPRPAAVVDEPPAALPRRAEHRRDPEHGPERHDRRQERGAERARGAAEREDEEPLARQPRAALLHDLDEHLLLLRVLLLGIVLLELLGDDQLPRRHDEPRADQHEREPDRKAHELRLVRDEVGEAVDDRERDRRERAEAEQRDRDQLPARVPRLVRDDPLAVRQLRAAASEEEDARGDDGVPDPTHGSVSSRSSCR
jgi:hypothetical protein